MKHSAQARTAFWYPWVIGLTVLTLLTGFVLPPAQAAVLPTGPETAGPSVQLANPLRISQIYGGGGNTGAPFTHDYIELYNSGSAPVNVNGWSVQYASQTGSTWTVTPLGDKTIPAGGLFLVQLAGGANGAPLPAADASGSTNMSASSGKVILSSNTTPLAGSCPTDDPTLVDLVGYGLYANCREGTFPTPPPSNTTAVIRGSYGCTDTDNNDVDFDTGMPAPRNSASPAHSCSGSPIIRLSQVYGGGGNAGATYNQDFVELFNAGNAYASLNGYTIHYASSTGSSWSKYVLSNNITIPTGDYVLVALASGANGEPLPTADASSTAINLSGTTGKVALTNVDATLTGTCPISSDIIDFLGYGAANCSEGTAAQATSATTASLRAGGGCTDTNNNSTDFTSVLPSPRNSASPNNTCQAASSGDLVLSMSGGAWRKSGDPVQHTISVTNSGIAPQASGLSYTSSIPTGLTYLSDTSGITPTLTSPGVYTWNLEPLADGASLSFDITMASSPDLTDGTALVHQGTLTAAYAPGDNPTNNAASTTELFYVVVPILTARTAASGVFTVEGMVIMTTYTVSAGEWALQDETGGIAVFHSSSIPTLALGDLVRVRGTRGVYNNQEQLTSVVFLEKLASGPEVEPLQVGTGEAASGSTEGWLVQTEGLVSGLAACSNTSFLLDDGSGPIQIYSHANTGIDLCALGLQNGLRARLTGFSSQYSTTYQIKIRRPADVDILYDAPQITKQAPGLVSPGQVFTYTLTVANSLGYDLTGVVVTDALPEFASYRSGGVFEDGLVSWEIPVLEDETSLQLQFSVTAADSLGVWIVNDTYAITASNFITPTYGSPLTTIVDDRMRIRHIQGAGDVSPLVGQSVTGITGIVTHIHADGFFIQDPEPDIYESTSEGVFVRRLAAQPAAPAVGSAVTVSGTVRENFTFTRIEETSWTAAASDIVIEPLVITLPVDTTLERYEGMLVTLPQTLTISQNYFQGQFGQLTLSSGGRMFNPNNGNDLGDTYELNWRRMLVLDDGTEASNPQPVPYLPENFLRRAGDEVAGLTGVIDYGLINTFSSGVRHYRIQPVEAPVFNAANHRPQDPEEVGGSLRIASYNVLNYFNGSGDGTGFPTTRGARTYADFVRQRTKIIAAITALQADVIGLMEMENDGTGALSAVQDLVNGLNAAEGAGTFAFIVEPAPGTDEIKVSLIYRTAAVAPSGAAQNFQVASYQGYTPLYDRPPLAQTFTDLSSGEQFSVVVNHFKSKGSCPASGPDADQNDGAGCWNAKRTAQATYMLEIAAELQQVDPKVIVMGDLNSYGIEAPMQVLKNGGLEEQLTRFVAPEQRYSYVFDGMAGDLDHTLVTAALAARVTGATTWHINADEPAVLDYSTQYNPPSLYEPNAFRSSDHDPVILGLELHGLIPTFESNSPVVLGQAAVFTNTTTGPEPVSYEWNLGDGSPVYTGTAPVHIYQMPGSYTVVLTATNPYESAVFSAAFEVVDHIQASFESNTPVLLGSPAVFTNTTSGPGPFSYTWDFGDGTPVVTDTHPSHLFSAAGSYQVVLTADNGMETSVYQTAFVVAAPLQVSFDTNSPVLLGEEMLFTSQVSGYGPYSYAWDFGDGLFSSDANPTHLYTEAGSYTATLVVENAFESLEFSAAVQVIERLSASFSTNAPVLMGDMMVFTSTVSGPGPYTYAWDFGDGGTASSANPTHGYEAPGSYLVTLTASNDYESVQASAEMIVLERLLVSFTSSSPIMLGEAAEFISSVSGPGPYTYAWDFGDENISDAANPTHQYEAAGQYQVVLRVSNPYESKVFEQVFRVLSPSNVVITKQVSAAGPVQPGEGLIYTVRLANNGEETVEGLSVLDVLPEALEWGGWVEQPEGAEFAGGRLSWSGSLEGGLELTLVYQALVKDNPAYYGAEVVNTAVFSIAGQEAGMVAAAVQVSVPPILSITKTAETASGQVSAGEAVTYTITVRNSGGSTAAEVRIVDTLPTNLLGTDLDETVEIEAGEAVTFTVTAVLVESAQPGSTITNTASYTYGAVSGSASASFRVAEPPVSGWSLYLPLLMR